VLAHRQHRARRVDTPAHLRAELEADLARWREVTRKASITPG